MRLARLSRRLFVSAVITCGAAAAEEGRRLLSAGRAESGMMELRDAGVLREFRGTWEVWV